MEGESCGGGGVEIKAWKEQLSPLWKVWDNLTKSQLSKLKSVEVRGVNANDPPVVAFLLMDAAEAAQLENLVSISLSNIQKVVNGTGMSTPDIQHEARTLIRQEVPPKWAHGWPSGPEEPTVFLQGLAKRIVALKSDWLQRVGSSKVFEKPAQLSDFLRPNVFLNALRQQTARKLAISIDSLHLVSTFEPGLLSDPASSPIPVSIQGLILEGSSFDEPKKLLVESTRTSPLTSILPLLTIAWMSRAAHPERAASSAQRASTVAMPIYVSRSREQLVGEVHLFTDSNRQRILNSAALFLTENY